MLNHILVSNDIDENLDILVVDFDINSIGFDNLNHCKKIISNLEQFNNSIYITTSDEIHPICNDLIFKDCGIWNLDIKRWALEFKNMFKKDKIQLSGIYRELCIVEVAKGLLSVGITPIIIDSDSYTISAEYSVKAGDTLENRIKEVGCNKVNI